MAASDTEIVNRALTLLGVDPINSLNDSDKAASVANRLYDDTRSAVFRSHTWSCLIKRANLPLDSITPAYEFAYQFILPADFLRLVELEDKDARYRIESRKILFDSNILRIKYVAMSTDVTSYDPLLVDALTARLAADMANPLLQSNEAMERMWTLYNTKIKEARFVNAQENSQEVIEADYWLESRNGVSPSFISPPPRY